MLTRLYIDNYRALVNCELILGRRTLIMGRNGSGKTTFGEGLIALQLLICGDAKTDAFFDADSLTRWQQNSRQRFELDVTAPHGTYQYQLIIEHDAAGDGDRPQTRIARETLTLDSKPLYQFIDGTARLFADDHTPGPEYPFDTGRSPLGSVGKRADQQKLAWFTNWALGLTVVKPNPQTMQELVKKDELILFHDARNFAAWYHHASASDKRRDQMLHKTLADVLPGFEAMNFEFAGPNRWLLRADFAEAGRKMRLRFTELSDGQRQLILLYALSHFLLEQGRTVFLDEPDNFISLDEIQPWLLAATDTVDDGHGQLILVSHHPEIFNQWATDHGIVTARDGFGPVRVSKFQQSPGTGLRPADEVARGWLTSSENPALARTGG